MLPETLGLFLLGLYAGKKDIFRRAKELDPKLKKWQIIMFILTLPMWFIHGRHFFINNQSYNHLSYGHYDDKRKNIIHLLHFHTHALITKRKMANIITTIPICRTNGVNKLHHAYNCYVTCIRPIFQKLLSRSIMGRTTILHRFLYVTNLY